jgi:hypothetical protein
MQKLVDTIRDVLPGVIKEFNEKRLPALEAAWGRSFSEEMQNENQVTVEIAKNYARPLNNTFFRHINEAMPEFQELTTDGSDYMLGDIPIEDKNSFSPDSNGWVGNGFAKTDWHLLKKFRVDSDGKITEAFIALVNLAEVQAAWSDRQINTNRSVISFNVADEDKVIVVWGNTKRNPKNLKPLTESV